MVTATRLAEIAAADSFLADAKTLDGPPPKWGDGLFGGEYQDGVLIDLP